MSTNPKQNSSDQGEIDLLYLFVKLGDFLKKAVQYLISSIGSVLVFLLRKWYYFTLAIILTIISAVILSNISEPQYVSDMVLRSNDKNTQVIASTLDKLGEQAAEGNFSSQSDRLNLSKESAENVKNIETFRYYDIGKDGLIDGIDTEGRYLSDTSVATIDSLIVVRTIVTDPEILQDLEAGICSYLESNPFLFASNKQRLSYLKEMIVQASYELEKLDSLQKKEYYRTTDQTMFKEGQLVFTNENNVQLYHGQMFKLLESKKEYEKELTIYPGIVTVIEGFISHAKPENNTTQYIRILIWYYLAVALILSLVITYRKRIWVPRSQKK